MTMSDTLIVISLIVGLGASLTAIGLLFRALFPAWTRRAQARVAASPGRALLAGIGVALAGGLPVALLLANPNGQVKFVGLVGLLALFLLAFAGTAGVAGHVGSRLPSPIDEERPWRATIRGWVVIFLASLLPLAGWFILLPAALITGLGAAFLGRRETPIVTDIEPSRPREAVSRENGA